jgi:hypothetical protein
MLVHVDVFIGLVFVGFLMVMVLALELNEVMGRGIDPGRLGFLHDLNRRPKFMVGVLRLVIQREVNGFRFCRMAKGVYTHGRPLFCSKDQDPGSGAYTSPSPILSDTTGKVNETSQLFSMSMMMT